MKRMKAIIVDDESRSRNTLTELIKEYCPELEVIGEAGDVIQARDRVLALDPDVVFLDISMPRGNGFDLLRNLQEITFEVIFVTAYNEYALQAIKASALDYLLKPVSITELRTAVERLKNRVSVKNTVNNIRQFLESFNQTPASGSGRIAVPAGDGLTFIQLPDIIKLVADGSYTRMYLMGGKEILSTRNMKEYEDMLPAVSFVRVHHSYIINLDHVKHYYRGEGGTVVMCDNSEILVSRRKKRFFLDRFSV